MNSPSPSEEDLFNRALARPAAGRSAFLAHECAADAYLRARVESLLRAHDEANSFMKSAAPGVGETVAAFAPRPEEKAGDRIGRYKLLQQIGEGGCGVVYMAEQTEPVVRRVALKVIKLGMDTKAVIARFEAERQALAMMDHPNIAKVLDAGTTDNGRPFFVMELVRGVPITKYCDDNNLATADRLKLFGQVCHAIQHAHQKGIIHRDIKPSNILVTLHDGVPVPKVIDFGIAKATQGRLTDATLFTAFEQFIGTPAYMSPEQAEMTGLDIDTRADIYSLGVLLYELLTGGTPFNSRDLLQAGLDEMRRQIREVEPPKPSTRLGTMAQATLTSTAQRRHTDAPKLINLIDGDLDWIVMRCLEKDRTRRYETANGLADDIARHLDNEPVTARPPSTGYRLGKAIRRNKVAFGAGAAIVASLAVGVIVATTAYFKEKAAHEFAVQAALAQQKISEDAQKSSNEALRLSLESRTNEKKARIEAAKNAYTLPLLQAAFQGAASDSLSAPARARLRQSLDQFAERLDRDSTTQPEAKNEVYETLGDAYMQLGEFGRAERMYRGLLALRQNLFGPMHAETAAALDKLREALRRQGQPAAADAELKSAQASQSDFLRTWRGARYLMDLGRKLAQQGRYSEANDRLRQAREVFSHRDFGRGIDWTRVMDTEIMPLYFQTGDFPGAKTIAKSLLGKAKNEQWWTVIDNANVVSAGHDWEWTSSKANLLLGRISLREGDSTAAEHHLLAAVNVYSKLRGWNHLDLDLPAELLVAGERTTVLRFVDLVERATDNWEIGDQWEENWWAADTPVYILDAWNRLGAVNIDQLKKDISAGRVPEDWKKQLSPPPLVKPTVSLPPLPTIAEAASVSHRIESWLSRLQYPLCFQMGGWIFIAPILWRRPRRVLGLSLRAAGWLAALGALCLFEGALLFALYWGVFGYALRVVFQTFCLQAILALAAGLALWEIRRALRGETAVGRTTLLLRGSLLYLAAYFVLKAETTKLTNSDGPAPDFIYFMTVFVAPLLWVTAIGIVLGVALELWKWTKRNATLPLRTKLCLYLAAPILGAQVVTCSWAFLEGIHLINRPWAISLLWLNVLLPWLLVGGYVAATRSSGQSRTPPLATAP